MLGAAVANGINASLEMTPNSVKEAFENQTGMSALPFRSALVSALTVLVVLVVLLFVGQFLWNNVLHELVPAVKEAKSVWQILGLAVLLMLLNPGSCSC
jgi:hypothetical protein